MKNISTKSMLFSATLMLAILLSACQPVLTPTAHSTQTPSPGIPPQTRTGQAIPLTTALLGKMITPTTSPSATLTARSGASRPLDFVHMCSDEQGWAIAAQSVLRTENGGKSWSVVTPAGMETVASSIPTPAPQRAKSIELRGAFLDAQTAWIAAPDLDKITIFHTGDGGLTWQTNELVVTTPQQVYPIEINSFTFLNAQTGWLLRSTGMAAGQGFVELYLTQNSGVSWHQTAEANQNISGGETGNITTNGQKTGVSFRDTANGWLTGSSHDNAIFLYRTKDEALTWNYQKLSVPEGYTAESGSAQSYPATFFDDKKGVMPIYLASTTPSINLFFYMTTDGGDHWVPTTPLKSAAYRFVWSWPDFLHGFAAEDGTGILYITSDASSAWSKSTVAGVKFSQIDFISPLIGWALSDGYLVQTIDGGKNWQLIYP